MEDIVYETEVLPELEIEEALTLEQMLAYQPRFVAYSEQDILAYLHQLIKSTPQRAEMFARLHRDTISATAHMPSPNVVFTPIGLGRKNYEDVDFIQEMTDAKQASSYTVQQMGIDRVMFPFLIEDDVDTNTNRPTIEMDANIDLVTNDNVVFHSKVLKTDPAHVLIGSARWKLNHHKTEHPDYLFDPSLPTHADPVRVRWDAGDPMDIAEWIMMKVRPTLQHALNALHKPVDIHTLSRIFAKYGRDIQGLHVKEFQLLQKHLEKLEQQHASIAIHDEDESQGTFHANHKFTKRFVTFEDTLKGEGTRATILTGDDQNMRLQQVYQTQTQGVPPLPQQVPIPTPNEIAKDLRSGTVTIETISELLIHWYLRWFLDNLTRFIERYNDSRIDMDEVEKYVQRMGTVGESIMLTATFDFIHRYSDVAEVKEGNDTSMYDGAPSIAPRTIFEENENEEYAPPSQIVSANEIAEGDIDALNIFENTTTSSTTAPSSSTSQFSSTPIIDSKDMESLSLEPGQKEIFNDSWRKIHVIQVASGLPMNVINILRWCKQYVNRPSRLEQVMRTVPGISEAIANRIIHDDLMVVSERIQSLYSKEWREQLQQSYKQIHEEWMQASKHTILLILTRWWIELCDQSLRGTLHFTPLQGLIQHIHTWGSYGPPMQPEAKSGIQYYLTNVAETVIGLDARAARDDMRDIAAERMPGDLQDIEQRWKELQASDRLLNRSDRARMLLENTIKALKSGQGGVDILAGYLPGILYLPQLLPANRVSKKAASWIQGCCAAPLDETFKADNDWRTQLSALYKIKRFLSKERWSVQARAELNGFHKPVAHPAVAHPAADASCAHPSIPSPSLHDSISASELFGMNLQDECWQWIPRSQLDMLMKHPNTVEGWAKTLIDQMHAGEKTKSTVVYKAISQITSVSSLISFLNRIGKNIQEKMYSSTITSNPIHADMLSKMKSCLRKIPSGKVSSTMITYACVVAIGMPATIDNNNLSLPTEITRDIVSHIWNKNYQTCNEWSKFGFMMNSAEVQAFITRVREQQKELSLQRLDILSIEDRQTLLDAKNLGLMRIVQFSEIDAGDQDHEQDNIMDMEGEQDFVMESFDADQNSDIL